MRLTTPKLKRSPSDALTLGKIQLEVAKDGFGSVAMLAQPVNIGKRRATMV